MEKHMGTDAYQLLRHEILHGPLMPGDRLRISELNERYRLGLTPTREALMRLASEGLVAWKSHRGGRVAPIDVEDFRDIIRTRREIGRLCLARAIELGDAAWEAEMMRSFHLLKRTPFPDFSDAAEKTVTWERLHREFHCAVFAACGSPWLLRFWDTLADQAGRYRKLLLVHAGAGPAVVHDFNREHEEIMHAVIARDLPAAIALQDRHFTQTEEAVARLVDRSVRSTA
ncbi:MAG: FCD domain-containing protein [Boseongicola sp. SB0677_bin_26]|nr:FCD domain-containing protein [Boseongicola sp. SB0665_bin_10]MYG27973.1 FCD domain-containing protein [Boseongicola sp. SB0677_bin_26]